MTDNALMFIAIASTFAAIGGMIGIFYGYEQGCSDTRKWLVDRERARRS